MLDIGQILFLFVFAVVVGAYGTIVGAGGGFLIVPMLLLVLHFSPQQAVGTSLAVVFFNALSGTLSYARQKRIDFQTGIRFALATIPGAVIGAYLSIYLTGRLFSFLFGVLLIALAGLMVARPREARVVAQYRSDAALGRWHTRRVLVDAAGKRFEYTFHRLGGIALSFVIGFISSILGIGGGIIHVPALVYLFSFPAHVATATSLFILTISALVGTSSHLVLGNVLPVYALLMAIGVIMGAQVGARIAHRLKGTWIVRLLSLALVGVGIRLIVGAIASG